MLESTRYRLMLQAHPAQTLMGKRFTEYHFTLAIDAVIWRDGVASSPEALGRAIGDAVRDIAERVEQQ